MPFKIYTDFECNMKRVRNSDRSDNASYSKKYQKHIPCSFACKVCIDVDVDGKFSKPVVLYKGKKMQSIDSLKQFLKSIFKK